MKTILILANSDMGLYKFRKELLENLVKKYRVVISVPEGAYKFELEKIGCVIQHIDIDRRGMNPIRDVKLYLKYQELIKKEFPDCILMYTVKPNVYGGLAARFMKIPYLINITGLGTAFENILIRKFLVFMYKIAFLNAHTIFFQNESNKSVIEKYIHISNKSILLPGSGVNTTEFPLCDYPNSNKTSFLYIGRLMKDKGVHELLEAFNKLKDKYDDVELCIVGPKENGFQSELFDKLPRSNFVRYEGLQSNVKKYLHSCNVLVNPSYHEGMSNVALEASSSGRPCLVSNIPGCREIVIDGKTGFLFEPKDVNQLYKIMEKFHLLSTESKKKMGVAAHNNIVSNFDRNIVIDEYNTRIEDAIYE